MRQLLRELSRPGAPTVVVLVAMALCAAPGNAQVVFSDFGANNTFSTNSWCVSGATTTACGPATLRSVAAPFTASATFNLQSITLALSYNSGTNTAVIWLNQDNGGVPGGLLESWTVTNLPAGLTPSLTTVTDNLGLTLKAGQTYWVVVQSVAGDTLLGWNRNNLGLNGAVSAVGLFAPWLPFTGSGTLPAFSVAAVPGAGSTFFSGFGPNNSATGSWNVGGVGYSAIAAPFTPGATFTLQTINLGLVIAGGPSSGAIVSLLPADPRSAPANVTFQPLETWTVTNLSSTYFSTFPNNAPWAPITSLHDRLNLTLQAGQQYWLQVQGTGQGTVLWESNGGPGGGIYISPPTLTWQPLSAAQSQLGFSVSGVRTGALAHITAGGGWTTEISLVNTSASANNIRVQFNAEDGTPLSLPVTTTLQGAATNLTASSVSATLNPNATFFVTTNSQAASAVAGSADVFSTGSLDGFAIFHYTLSSTSESEGTVPLQKDSTYSITLPYDNTGGLLMGVALASLAPVSTQVTATFLDDSANQLGSPQVFSLAGNGHTSFVLSAQYPVTAGKRGIVTFTTVNGSLSGLGLRFSPSLTFTSVPTIINGPLTQ